MYSKQDLMNDLKEMGLQPTDTVLVHSSYKSIAGDRGIEGGAETVIDAFIEYFGKDGLIVFPTLTWKFGFSFNDQGEFICDEVGNDEYKPYGNRFDVRNTDCRELGILPELFRRREGVIRSLSATHSVAAFGKDAKAFCEGNEKVKTTLGWDSPWGKFYDRNAKMLFLGTTMACNTYMHVLEERANVPGLIKPTVYHYEIVDYDGKVIPAEVRRHEPGHSHYFDKVRPELTAAGIVKDAMFGSAVTQVVDVRAETDYMMKKFKEEPFIFFHEYNQ